MADALDPIAERIIRSNEEMAREERIRAAAPALLEALEAAEEALFTAEPYSMSTHDKLSVVEARQRARTAIAQARGGDNG